MSDQQKRTHKDADSGAKGDSTRPFFLMKFNSSLSRTMVQLWRPMEVPLRNTTGLKKKQSKVGCCRPAEGIHEIFLWSCARLDRGKHAYLDSFTSMSGCMKQRVLAIMGEKSVGGQQPKLFSGTEFSVFVKLVVSVPFWGRNRTGRPSLPLFKVPFCSLILSLFNSRQRK